MASGSDNSRPERWPRSAERGKRKATTATAGRVGCALTVSRPPGAGLDTGLAALLDQRDGRRCPGGFDEPSSWPGGLRVRSAERGDRKAVAWWWPENGYAAGPQDSRVGTRPRRSRRERARPGIGDGRPSDDYGIRQLYQPGHVHTHVECATGVTARGNPADFDRINARRNHARQPRGHCGTRAGRRIATAFRGSPRC
jgi:hypothetical protein